MWEHGGVWLAGFLSLAQMPSLGQGSRIKAWHLGSREEQCRQMFPQRRQ